MRLTERSCSHPIDVLHRVGKDVVSTVCGSPLCVGDTQIPSRFGPPHEWGEGVWSLVIKTERLTFALRRLRDGEEWYWSCKVGSTCDYSERLSDSLAGLPLT